MDSSVENLRLVCAVIDVQGFYFSGVFFPRELAITNGTTTRTLVFNPSFDETKIPYKQKKTVIKQRDLIHGLSFHAFGNDVYESCDFNLVLKLLHKIYSQVSCPYFAVANTHLAKILDNLEIGFVDLTRGPLKMPSGAKLDLKYKTDNWLCSNHNNVTIPSSNNFRCSLRKVTNTWKWINETSMIVLMSRLKIK